MNEKEHTPQYSRREVIENGIGLGVGLYLFTEVNRLIETDKNDALVSRMESLEVLMRRALSFDGQRTLLYLPSEPWVPKITLLALQDDPGMQEDIYKRHAPNSSPSWTYTLPVEFAHAGIRRVFQPRSTILKVGQKYLSDGVQTDDIVDLEIDTQRKTHISEAEAVARLLFNLPQKLFTSTGQTQSQISWDDQGDVVSTLEVSSKGPIKIYKRNDYPY